MLDGVASYPRIFLMQVLMQAFPRSKCKPNYALDDDRVRSRWMSWAAWGFVTAAATASVQAQVVTPTLGKNSTASASATTVKPAVVSAPAPKPTALVSAAAKPAAAPAPKPPPPEPADVVQRDYYYSTSKAHSLLERYVPPGALLLFGDSLIQGMNAESLHPNPVNFGITGDTTAGLMHRMRDYRSLYTASVVVLESGINDMGFGRKFDQKIELNYARILSRLPPTLDIYLLGIFPVNEKIDHTLKGYNKRIKKINSRLLVLCERTPRCVFVDVGAELVGDNGNVSQRYLRPKDGIHLNEEGKEIVLAGLRSSMKKPTGGRSE